MSPKQRKRTPKERAAEVEAAETEAAPEAEGAAGEGEEPATDDAATAEDQPSRRPRKRGAAETAPAPTPARARRSADRDVVVRARAKYVRSAPRKTRLVIAHIRGKSVGEARAILTHTPRAASHDILTLLDSCVANAENNHELVADELYVDRAYVDEGPTLKRYRPRALGRATRINKRTSHMTIALRPRAGEE